ncbi:MAG TPA: hypothetical protein DEA73_07915 [Peptococcaceae bacterium]|nr:MAG: hypothetical protein XD51_0220 [Moorella sp. 60_41]HBT47783.1 hypothetical protein [Peptococcaceae bacterium]
MWEKILGLPREEAEAHLAEAGYRVAEVKFTGREPGSTSEGEDRVVRVRVVGAGQVELVLAPVYTQPPAKGGGRKDGLPDY